MLYGFNFWKNIHDVYFYFIFHSKSGWGAIASMARGSRVGEFFSDISSYNFHSLYILSFIMQFQKIHALILLACFTMLVLYL